MLETLKVLSIEQYGAGPFGTQFLVDMGAEVIKIETPKDGGDMARSVGPSVLEGLDKDTSSVFFQGLNRGKKSLTLDLENSRGYEVFLKLVETADAVTHNLRGDVPNKLRINYESLKFSNPKIICVHLTGYGREGERASWPGYDFLMQAETGYFHLTGDPKSSPARAGLSLVDLMTGSVASLSLVSGVLSARETGKGRDIDVSLFDLALYNLNYIGNWYLNNKHETTRLARSAHASLTPCQTYKTQDGWIYIMCNKEKFWKIFCQKIERPELIEDMRFLTFKERLQNRDKLTPIIDQALSIKKTNEWMNLFKGFVPAAPILKIKDALNTDWVKTNGRLDSIPIGENNSFKFIASPIRYQNASKTTLAPSLGQHTLEILKENGYSVVEIEKLKSLGII
jgi:succinate---hydroxymethylglutarate CoA-transferase